MNAGGEQLRAVARRWGLPAALIDAIERAEGGPDALLRAVRCSVVVRDYVEALEVTCRTVTHALADYAQRERAAFIAFLGARWAPIGAANDPGNLNKTWIANVLAILERGV